MAAITEGTVICLVNRLIEMTALPPIVAIIFHSPEDGEFVQSNPWGEFKKIIKLGFQATQTIHMDFHGWMA